MAGCLTQESNGSGLHSAVVTHENDGATALINSGLPSAVVMAENGAALHSAQGNAGCVDIEDKSAAIEDWDDDSKRKYKCMFDQLLSAFSKETDNQGIIKPMPARLGDGRAMDLFMLFWVVNRKQGFDFVQKNNLWPSVVQELELGLEFSPSVKLMYAKYLYQLEKWCKTSFESTELEDSEFETRIKEVGTEFRSLFSNGSDQTMTDDNTENVAKFDDDENIDDNDKNDLRIEHPEDIAQELNLRKRKRDSLVNMLNWVIQIAKCPRDPSVGPIPHLFKRKAEVGDENCAQAIRAREVLYSQKHTNSTIGESFLQGNQKMHPSMYEDVVVSRRKPTEKLKSSERLPPTLKKSHSDKMQLKKGPKGRGTEKGRSSSYRKKKTIPHMDFIPEKRAREGPEYQTEVPEWTGVVSESDSKWLGTRLWPLEEENQDTVIETNSIINGRRDLCICQLPGSVECYRFHIVENRMKLKLELGPVFYRWQFHRMGEEVTLRWTAEEEKRFKDLVMSEPSFLREGFRNGMSKYFPKMTRADVISYYFNVFKLQRRRYQNRVHFLPHDISSDEDDYELGSIGMHYGHEAIKVVASDTLICSLNTQSFEIKPHFRVDVISTKVFPHCVTGGDSSEGKICVNFLIGSTQASLASKNRVHVYLHTFKIEISLGTFTICFMVTVNVGQNARNYSHVQFRFMCTCMLSRPGPVWTPSLLSKLCHKVDRAAWP
ncbi:hypothetical protein ACFE04_018147 [Oxalis oulophora]